MSELTVPRLMEIMQQCAGVDDDVDVTGDVADVPFVELGYDSLALLETAARLERQYGVRLDDDAVSESSTPRALVDLVTRARPRTGA